jgi:hypothetical protein
VQISAAAFGRLFALLYKDTHPDEHITGEDLICTDYGLLNHDNGKGACWKKMALPGVLTKKQKLKGPRSHPQRGADAMQGAPAEVIWIIAGHHLRPDNHPFLSYPRSLHRRTIPEYFSPWIRRVIQPGVLATIDALHAMVEHRSYRPDLTDAQIFTQLKLGKGTQFDEEFATLAQENIPLFRELDSRIKSVLTRHEEETKRRGQQNIVKGVEDQWGFYPRRRRSKRYSLLKSTNPEKEKKRLLKDLKKKKQNEHKEEKSILRRCKEARTNKTPRFEIRKNGRMGYIPRRTNVSYEPLDYTDMKSTISTCFATVDNFLTEKGLRPFWITTPEIREVAVTLRERQVAA